MGISDLNPFKKGEEGKNNHFVCPWCGLEFNLYIKTSTSNSDKRGKVTNQVRCKKCKTFLPSNSGEDV